MRVDYYSSGSNNTQKTPSSNIFGKIFFGIVKFFGKIFFPFVGCFMQFVYLSVFLFLVFTYFFVKIGLWDIPLISSWLYTPPEPRNHVVFNTPEDHLQTLNNKIGKFILQNEDHLTFSNHELTSLFRTLYKPNDFMELNAIQAISYYEGVELYAEVKSPFSTVIILELIPSMKNKKMELDVKKVYVGDQRVPSALFDTLLMPVLEHAFTSFLQQLGNAQAVTYKENKLIVEFQGS